MLSFAKTPFFLATCVVLVAGALSPADAQRRKETGEQAVARAVEGRTAGEPVNCVRLSDIRSTRIIDRTAIVYDAGRTIYIQRPRTGAEGLRRDDILVTQTFGSDLCTIDSVRLLDPAGNFLRGFVTLDRFVPYTRPPR